MLENVRSDDADADADGDDDDDVFLLGKKSPQMAGGPMGPPLTPVSLGLFSARGNNIFV